MGFKFNALTGEFDLVSEATPRVFTKVVSRTSDGNPDYICDGTDDDVQIQAAIDAVTTNGGTVFLRNGTYNIGAGIVLKSNVSLEGENRGKTIIFLQNNTTIATHFGLINSGGSAIDNFCVRNITLDGNKANQTANNDGIFLLGTSSSSVTNGLIENVLAKNAKLATNQGYGFSIVNCLRVSIKNCISNSNDRDGFDLETFGSGSLMVDSCVAYSNGRFGFYTYANNDGPVNLVNCMAYSNTSDGFDIGDGGNTSSVSNCFSLSNGGHGFQLEGRWASCVGCTARLNSLSGFYGNYEQISIIGCHSGGNTQYGIFENGDTNVIISGNTINSNGKSGIVLSASYRNIVSNNTVDATAGLDADNTYSGILLSGTATKNIISGNSVYGAGTNSLAYGIRETDTTDNYNIITNNTVAGCDTAQISSQGANTDVSHNITT